MQKIEIELSEYMCTYTCALQMEVNGWKINPCIMYAIRNAHTCCVSLLDHSSSHFISLFFLLFPFLLAIIIRYACVVLYNNDDYKRCFWFSLYLNLHTSIYNYLTILDYGHSQIKCFH